MSEFAAKPVVDVVVAPSTSKELADEGLEPSVTKVV